MHCLLCKLSPHCCSEKKFHQCCWCSLLSHHCSGKLKPNGLLQDTSYKHAIPCCGSRILIVMCDRLHARCQPWVLTYSQQSQCASCQCFCVFSYTSNTVQFQLSCLTIYLRLYCAYTRSAPVAHDLLLHSQLCTGHLAKCIVCSHITACLIHADCLQVTLTASGAHHSFISALHGLQGVCSNTHNAQRTCYLACRFPYQAALQLSCPTM